VLNGTWLFVFSPAAFHSRVDGSRTRDGDFPFTGALSVYLFDDVHEKELAVTHVDPEVWVAGRLTGKTTVLPYSARPV
jgi:hypothetical protein